jgi:hypothetical protein
MTDHHLDRAEPRSNLLRHALDDLHRADVLKHLASGAAQGDADTFLGAIAKLTWPGAWVDALRALVSLGTVPSTIREAFQRAWQSSGSQTLALRRILTCDLLGQDALLLDGLAVLMPSVQPDWMPATVFRVMPRNVYRSGELGLWWTTEFDLAVPVSLATSAFHEWDGDLLLVSAETPGAVAYDTDAFEVLLDPRRLRSVRVIGTVVEERENALAA